MWGVYDANGKELARGSLTSHPGDMSWIVTRSFEADFVDLREKMDGPVTSYQVVVSREDPWWTAVAYGEGLPARGGNRNAHHSRP